MGTTMNKLRELAQQYLNGDCSQDTFLDFAIEIMNDLDSEQVQRLAELFASFERK